MARLRFDNLVDQPIFQCLVGGHKEITVRIGCNFFHWLITIFRHEFVQGGLGKKNFLCPTKWCCVLGGIYIHIYIWFIIIMIGDMTIHNIRTNVCEYSV
jgi:hypothetical protein